THGLVCHALVARHLALPEGAGPVQGFANTALTVAGAAPPHAVSLLACAAPLEGLDAPPPRARATPRPPRPAAPRFLFPFSFPVSRRRLGLAPAERSPRGRRRLLAELLFAVPAVAGFHALCFALDWVLFPSLRRQPVRTPVFVIGHARSGTTLLHRLLSEDRERFSSFLLWELYFPSLLH